MATSPDPPATDPEAIRRSVAAGAPVIPTLRQALRDADAAYAERFRAGTPASVLVPERAALMDAVVGELWRSALDTESPGGCSLLAVGGYGRGELHLGSDIDVLVVVAESERKKALTEPLEAFIISLWDLGLQIGHSVRTIEECVQAASDDITIATNLIEARYLAGSQTLFETVRALHDTHGIWSSRAFFEAKLAEQQERHAKFHDTAYNLEPNIKSTPGGLRDIQVVVWVAKRHFGVQGLQELVTEGFLTRTEHQILHAGQCFLWDVRFALHLVAGRCEDRLLFDYQLAIAELFGFTDDDRALAVEQLMQRYFRTALEISQLNEMLLQHFQEAILYAGTEEEPELERINSRFQIRAGFLEVTQADTFREQPFALLEGFLLLAQRPHLKGVRATTIRAIRQHRKLINEELRNDLRCRSIFMETLRQASQGVSEALGQMHRYGVLGRYIPAFGQIAPKM